MKIWYTSPSLERLGRVLRDLLVGRSGDVDFLVKPLLQISHVAVKVLPRLDINNRMHQVLLSGS
jgi:hypothetical protein